MDETKSANTLDRMMVKISHLNSLLGLVGEVIITSNNIHTTNRRIQSFYDRNQPLDKLSMDMIKAAEIVSNRISSDMHSLVMDIRMVEIKSTFQRFRRAVRDMAKEGGKQVEFVTMGDDTLVDKTIGEKLYDPLNHQIRNAIDHGIEDPLERQGQNKPTKARLVLKAYQLENNIFIEISDDGRGINADNITKAAIKRGLITEEEAAQMPDDEKLKLIFHPGLSTKQKASKLSGRGVGMDVVRSNIEELGGEITIDTKKNEGTTFTYRIPQVTAVNILDCLTIRAAKNHFAIPILNVISTLGIPADQTHTTLEKGRTIKYLDHLVPLFDLNELLGERPLDDDEILTVVIVEAKNGRLALRISELLTPEKLVYTSLADLFRVQGISGTTMISGNMMGLTLDVVELINRSKGIGEGTENTNGNGASRPSTTIVEEETEDIEVDEEPAINKAVVSLSSDIGREITHRDEFLVELDEMVKDADEQILTLETNPGDMDIINKLFRAFHSMKGNLMMVGLAELGEFIHEVESILDQARGGSLDVDTDIIDILLDAADTIKSAKQAISENKAPEIEKSLLKRIEKYKKTEKKKVAIADVHQLTFQIAPLDQFNLLAHRFANQNVFQVFIDFKPQYQEPFLVALLIMRRITKIGHVFGTAPSMEDIEAQNIRNQLKIMFSSALDEGAVKTFFDDVLVKHYDVTKYDILKTD